VRIGSGRVEQIFANQKKFRFKQISIHIPNNELEEERKEWTWRMSDERGRRKIYGGV
jgi:hypothetical protein